MKTTSTEWYATSLDIAKQRCKACILPVVALLYHAYNTFSAPFGAAILLEIGCVIAYIDRKMFEKQ